MESDDKKLKEYTIDSILERVQGKMKQQGLANVVLIKLGNCIATSDAKDGDLVGKEFYGICGAEGVRRVATFTSDQEAIESFQESKRDAEKFVEDLPSNAMIRQSMEKMPEELLELLYEKMPRD